MDKIIYAIKDDKLVFVDDVESGLKCQCFCPACHQPLIAKKGRIRIHHFAHMSLVDCKYAYETSLHLLAKEIIKEAKSFLIPSLAFESYTTFIYIAEQEKLTIKDVRLEQNLHDIKPDVIIEDVKGNKYCIEIYVTHAVDNNKLNKLQREKINTIEIDLSKISRIISKDELRDILLNKVNLKKWIYNTKLEDAMDYFSVPVEKLKNCSKQKHYKPNPSYCYNHCPFNITNSDDFSIVYCLKAPEVLFRHSLDIDENTKYCKKCGCMMQFAYNKEKGIHYKCTEMPICDNIEEIPKKTIEQKKFSDRCPNCNSKLKLRRAYSQIHHRYENFWGCSNFPKCTFTKNYK